MGGEDQKLAAAAMGISGILDAIPSLDGRDPRIDAFLAQIGVVMPSAITFVYRELGDLVHSRRSIHDQLIAILGAALMPVPERSSSSLKLGLQAGKVPSDADIPKLVRLFLRDPDPRDLPYSPDFRMRLERLFANGIPCDRFPEELSEGSGSISGMITYEDVKEEGLEEYYRRIIIMARTAYNRHVRKNT